MGWGQDIFVADRPVAPGDAGLKGARCRMGVEPGPVRRGTGSLAKALRILTEVGAAEPDALRLTELVSRAEIDSSTAFRMLACLVDAEFVEKVDGKRYRLGQRVFELGLAAGHHFRAHAAARERLSALADSLGGPVALSRRSGAETVYVERQGPELFEGLKTAIGTRLPIGLGSSGVALLAAMAPEEAEALMRRNERRYRAYGRNTSDVLRRHLDRAKKDGFARTVSFLRPDVGSIGVVVPPLGCRSGVPSFGLSLLCSLPRLRDADAVAAEMREAAHDAALAMVAARH